MPWQQIRCNIVSIFVKFQTIGISKQYSNNRVYAHFHESNYDSSRFNVNYNAMQCDSKQKEQWADINYNGFRVIFLFISASLHIVSSQKVKLFLARLKCRKAKRGKSMKWVKWKCNVIIKSYMWTDEMWNLITGECDDGEIYEFGRMFFLLSLITRYVRCRFKWCDYRRKMRMQQKKNMKIYLKV